MKNKLLITLLMLIFLIGIVSATNLEEIDFNIPSGFEPVEDAEGLQFVDDSKDVRIRIFDADENDWDSGYDQYNETVLVFDETQEIGDYDIYSFSYGEYVKIDGKEYWVEVSNDDIENRNSEACLEVLDYLNAHNNFDSVEV